MVRLALSVLVAAGVLASPAFAAAPPQRPAEPHSVTTDHFAVFYDSDPTKHDYATQTQATTLAAMAERAYAAETSWGYQAPIDDTAVPNGKIDIYVVDLSAFPGVLAVAVPDAAAAPTSGSIDVAASVLDRAVEQHTIAHELFHLIQLRTWLPASLADDWLIEGSAEWAGYKVDGYPSLDPASIGPSTLSLDCRDSIDGFQKCANDPYVDGGYSRWPFFEYVADRFGQTFVQDALAKGSTAGSAVSGLNNAIAARGASFSDVFTDWVVRQMTGGYGIPSLDALAPGVSATFQTGAQTADLGATTLSVDHLAARFVQFARGDGRSDHACYAAQLTITVALPNGVGARPYFVWKGSGGSVVPLAVSGSTASATVPWDTCTQASRGYLSLPNPTTNVDGADFRVSAKLTVDTTTPASAAAPPTPFAVLGTVVPVPTADVAPLIEAFGPELLRVSASSPTIRLIVESSGPGVLQATLGSAALGSRPLRAGNNDVRFAVPTKLAAGLRRTAVAANVLTLTPVSSSGAATGQAVTRRVSIAPAQTKKRPPK